MGGGRGRKGEWGEEREEEEEEEEERETCSGVPPTVKLLTAHAASFWVLNSALASASTIAGTRFASITI